MTAAALALATLASEDAACLAAGALVARGDVPLSAALTACAAGIFVGDLGLYAAGRLAPRVVSEARRERARAWYGDRMGRVVLGSRFLPGARLPAYLGAGWLRLPFLPFAAWTALAVALWTPLLVLAGSSLGRGAWLAGLLVFLLPLRSARRRALLRSRLTRLARWEFWPAWMVYPPVIALLLPTALRHRSLTLFTAVNPGIGSGGGVSGESKAAILESLRSGGAPVPAFILLGGGADRGERGRAFGRRHGYPLVAKPDVGARGRGVEVLYGPDDLERRLASDRGPLILQVHVAGEEYGLFWARRPGEPRGRLLSITTKSFPAITGDGRHTLEQLVLSHPHAPGRLPVLLAAIAGREGTIPPAGETVRLITIGNHSRGTVFLDGNHLHTPALEDAVERVARAHPGFDFGRLDVRVPDAAALREGRGLQVLELNGVTSEPTDIYDPSRSYVSAVRRLAAFGRLAFDIGARRRAEGHQPLGSPALLSFVFSR